MKNKPSAKPKHSDSSDDAASTVEKKLGQIAQYMKSHPSIPVGALVIGYCVFRLLFET